MKRLVLTLLVLLATAAPGLAAPGDSVERVFPMGAVQVPLPSGPWVVAAETREGEGPGTIQSVVLAQIKDQRVVGIILARANPIPSTAIFGTSAECDRSDIYLAYTAYDTPQDGLCGFANLVVAGGTEAPVWIAARDWLRGRGVTISETWLMAGFRARVRPRMLDVRYHFPPPSDAAGPWATNPWSPARIGDDPTRSAAIVQLGLWAAWMRDPVERGVRGRIEDVELPPMPFAGVEMANALITARLRALDRLRDSGAIGPEDYAQQRLALERVEAEPDQSEMPLWLRTVWKTVTYRVASIADSLAVSYILLGSVYQTLGFAVIGELIRPPAVYIHEIAWARSGIGRAAAPARPREFPDIGVTR